MLSALADLVAMAAGVLIARYLMRLATPKHDLEVVQGVIHTLKEKSREKLPNVAALRVRIYSMFGIDRLFWLRLKLAYAEGSYADDR